PGDMAHHRPGLSTLVGHLGEVWAGGGLLEQALVHLRMRSKRCERRIHRRSSLSMVAFADRAHSTPAPGGQVKGVVEHLRSLDMAPLDELTLIDDAGRDVSLKDLCVDRLSV